MIVADLDHDGDLDVVANGWRQNTLEWFENYGNQSFSFTPRVIADAIMRVMSINAVDF